MAIYKNGTVPTVQELNKEDGVKDLPIAARSKFMKALIAEANGETANAAVFLDEAVAAEEKHYAEMTGKK